MNALIDWLRQPRLRPNAPAREPPLDPTRVAKPRWPRLAEVSGIARRFPDTPRGMRRAWEACALAGAIPVDWVGNPARAFTVPARGADLWYDYPHPSTRSGLVAMAAGAADVLVAEQLLEAYRLASEPWLVEGLGRHGDAVKQQRGVAWWVARSLPRRPWHSGPLGAADAAATTALHFARERVAVTSGWGRDFLARVDVSDLAPAPRGQLLWRLRVDLLTAERYRQAAELELVVPEGFGSLAGRRFDSLTDPYAPLLGLWGTGFLPSATSSEFDSAVALAWKVGVR